MNREDLPFSPASERNRAPILEVMGPALDGCRRLLEIGAGTGQHAVSMAAALPGIEWWPTDRRAVLPALSRRLQLEAPSNVRSARALDVLNDDWPDAGFDAVYSANTAHIMGWPAVEAMFEGVGRVLVEGGSFFLYGPFNIDGRFTAPSNEAFDRDLRQRDPDMGIRDLGALEALARSHHLELERRWPMPANNFLLLFRRYDDDHEPG